MTVVRLCSATAGNVDGLVLAGVVGASGALSVRIVRSLAGVLHGELGALRRLGVERDDAALAHRNALEAAQVLVGARLVGQPYGHVHGVLVGALKLHVVGGAFLQTQHEHGVLGLNRAVVGE